MAYQQPPHPGYSAPASGLTSASRPAFVNPPFGDTTYTKVFVGGLAWETQGGTMRQYFEQFGEILEAVVITDKNSGRSKGYGFVTFRDPESALRACADPCPVIDGRLANCKLASLGRPRLPPTHAHVMVGGPYFGAVAVPRGAYVGSSGYHHPIPYSYPQGFAYPSYGMCIIHSQASNISKCIVFLKQLIHQSTHWDNRLNLFLVGMVIRQSKDMQCQLTI